MSTIKPETVPLPSAAKPPSASATERERAQMQIQAAIPNLKVNESIFIPDSLQIRVTVPNLEDVELRTYRMQPSDAGAVRDESGAFIPGLRIYRVA